MHGLGAYKGQAVMNCLEAFEANYAQGQRLFEIDLMMTQDGHIAAMHDGQEHLYGLSTSFTLAQFRSSSYKGTTPLAEDDIARLLKTKKDWFLITDVKTDNAEGLRRLCIVLDNAGVSCKKRVIPQIYNPAEMAIVEELSFDRAIFTMYRFGNAKDALVRFLNKNPRIWAVTMWADWWDEEYASVLRRHGVMGFVHTVNDNARAEELFRKGVSAIYTDHLPITRGKQ